jgi:xylan 1,4-beta-xylosidase
MLFHFFLTIAQSSAGKVSKLNHRQGKRILIVLAALLILPIHSHAVGTVEPNSTYCNPMNLENYLADPCLVEYKNEYYLCGSGSSYFYTTTDFMTWSRASNTPGGFAPGVWVKGDSMFYTSFDGGTLYRSTTPKTGGWVSVGKPFSLKDPAFFIDDDGKLYAIHGCAELRPVVVAELDPAKGYAIKQGRSWNAVNANPAKHGWERRGDNNELTETPWIEGGWILKYNGTYYFNYSAGGTEFRSYADGNFMAKSIEGPWVYAKNSPFSHKPTGFIAAAGHGATFKHTSGAIFRLVTMFVAGVQRRTGLFAVFFDEDGLMCAHNYFSDYPQFLPGKNPGINDSNFTGWMNLAYGKTVTASSGSNTGKAVDDDIRTEWSAASGNTGEWLMVDMGKTCMVQGVQVNFTTFTAYKYVVELSADGAAWETVIDKSSNSKIIQHEYTQMSAPVEARYARLTNKGAGSSFSQSDFRVFGNAPGTVPENVVSINATRMSDDMGAKISWGASSGAYGYVVRYGIAPARLYNCYEIRGGGTSVDIRSLNADVDYYCTVDAFNDVGIAKSGVVTTVRSLTSKTRSPGPYTVIKSKSIRAGEITKVFDVLGRSVGEVNVLRCNQQDVSVPVAPGIYIYRFDRDKSAAMYPLYLQR